MSAQRLKSEQVASSAPPTASASVVGWIAAYSAAEGWLVDYDGNPRGVPIAARTVLALSAAQMAEAAVQAREALLVFDRGDQARPIVTGLLQESTPTPLIEWALDDPAPRTADVDGERVEIDGEREIVLRCGEASITLRANGRIVLRGTYLESHATGTNRIKGGAVRIN